MKARFLLIGFLLVLPTFLLGQNVEVFVSKKAQESVVKNKASLTKSQSKIQSNLLELKEQYIQNGKTLQKRKNGQTQQGVEEGTVSSALVDTQDRVYVYVAVPRSKKIDDLIKAMAKIGIKPDVSIPNAPMVQVWLTIPQIEAVSALKEVGFIKMVTPGVSNTGPTLSKGVAQQRADASIPIFQSNGTGIKIGVMSDDCGGAELLLAGSIASGELKNTATFIDDSKGGSRSHEGLAMMEIVQDMAPNADLIFATASTGQLNYGLNIVNLFNAGCKVITDDVFYFDEPVYEDGFLAGVVDLVSANNAIYTCSAGNAALLSLFTTYNPLANQIIGGSGATNNVHNFGGGDFQNLTGVADTRTLTVVLQWDDAWGASDNDYDLFLVNNANGAVLASSTTVQNGTQDPYEILSWTNGTGGTVNPQIIVRRTTISGTDPNPTARIRLEARGGGFSPSMEFTNPVSTIYGHHAAATAVVTGAIDAADNNYNDIESFSSQGPVLIVNTTAAVVGANRPLVTTRIKPDLVSIDGVQTSVAGFQPFFGTSAAAPASAGIVAQLVTLYPTITNANALSLLQNSCIDYGAAGKDNVYGAGRLDAVKLCALARNSYASSLYVAGFTTPSSAIPDNNASGVNSVLALSPTCTNITPDSIFVSVTIDGHAKNGDLKITLKSPDNTTITLLDRPVSGAGTADDKNPNIVLGDGATTAIQTYNPAGAGNEVMGFYIPSTLISTATGFRGHALNGNWTLNVSDNAAGNTGILKDWGIYAKEGTPTPPNLTITWNPPFLTPNDHTMNTVTVANSLSGGCSPAVTLFSITNNEPDAGTGGGDIATDIQNASLGTNDLSFDLRSECKPQSAGRWYTVRYRITDVGGYQRDTNIYIPVICDGGHFDPLANSGAAGVLLDAAPSPNPLVSTSSISYTIPAGGSAPVRLRVTNALGKWVKNLDYGTKAPGTYTINWAGTRADGVPLPNGVYIYQLSVGAPQTALKTGVVILNH